MRYEKAGKISLNTIHKPWEVTPKMRVKHVIKGTIPCPRFNIRRAIKWRLHQYNICKTDAALALGYDKSSFSQFLSGKREAPAEVVLKMIALFGLRFDEVLPIVDPKEKQEWREQHQIKRAVIRKEVNLEDL